MNWLYAGAAFLLLLSLPFALAEDFTLNIFGNANMDEIIDERDIAYIGGIIDGSQRSTNLSDANGDGDITESDADVVKEIINGTEDHIRYINIKGEESEVRHPIENIIIVYDATAEVIRVLGAQDRVIAVDSLIQDYPRYLSEFMDTPSIGNRNDCDTEKILELNPDAILLHTAGSYGCPELESKIEGEGIDIIRLGTVDDAIPSLMMLAYMLDEVENATKYLEWKNDLIETVNERVSGIPGDEMPRVFISMPGNITANRDTGYSKAIELAGGVNIAADIIRGWENRFPDVDQEWLLQENPDAIVGIMADGGYENDDMDLFVNRYKAIKEEPGIENINAGKDNKIYISHYSLFQGPNYPLGVLYFAKWLYPDLFQDLDPQAVHQEYLKNFQQIDFDLKEHGTFTYSPMS